MISASRRALLVRLAWLALAVPALIQLCLLGYAIALRFSYPYDLEWMEGGLLVHAERIAGGDGIYLAPSIEFIPYLYTPLYPGVVATLGSVVGISYQLGRAISILALFGIFVVGAASLLRDQPPAVEPRATLLRSHRLAVVSRGSAAAWAGVATALGLIAAAYPYVEGWYDLVRADTLFLFLVIGGLYATYRLSRGAPGLRGHLQVATAGAILALAFFCKQTGIVYVAAGGAIVLVRNWRRVPAFVLASAAIGLGGAWFLQRATGGWFWTYAFKVHQAHDFSMDRFWSSFGKILFHFPAMTAVLVLALALVAAAAWKQRRLPAGSGPLLLWAWAFAVSCLVGALGWGTQWAHFNAYMPALFTGAFAAGAAVPAIIGAVAALRTPAAPDGASVERFNFALAAGMAAALALGVQLVLARWEPGTFIPTAADRAAGHALIERIRQVEGDVWVPSHPWYAHLAGKQPWVHRMGMKDVTYGGKWRVAGLEEALREHRFAELFLDNRDVQIDFPVVGRYYRRDDKLPRDERPHLYTGAEVVPESIWVPAVKQPPPPGAETVFDFESGKLEGWTVDGTAWGSAPVTDSLTGQGPVRRWRGRWFADSMHGGDDAIGTLTSPPFELHGARLSFLMSGGADKLALRAELRVDGKAVRTTSNSRRGELMTEYDWEIADLRGQTGTMVFIDDATGSWGHLSVDEVLLWR